MRLPSVNKPPLFTGASAVYPWADELKEAFTVTDRFGEEVQLWHRSGERIMLPRAACPLAADDRRVLGVKLDLTTTFEPRSDEQARVVDETAGFLGNGQSGVLQATTGFGKTACACAVIQRTRRKTLVVVPKEDLMRQWRDAIAKFLPGSKVGTIRQNTYDVAGKDIVLGMLHSLSKRGKYPASMRQEFGLVVWDEVHRVPADSFSYTAGLFPARLRLGLSATPERRDGREIVVEAHLGPVRVKTALMAWRPKVAIYDSPWRIPMVRCNHVVGEAVMPPNLCTKCNGAGVIQLPHGPGKCGHVINHLVKCRPRNRLIWQIAGAGYRKRRNTVLFSDRVAHLEMFYAKARQQGVPECDVTLYISGMSEKERELASAKRLILATYPMMAEGTDIPWLDLGIMGTPRSRIVQPMGRILREYEGKPQPVWVDFSDRSSTVFKSYERTRLRQYREARATVERYRSK